MFAGRFLHHSYGDPFTRLSPSLSNPLNRLHRVGPHCLDLLILRSRTTLKDFHQRTEKSDGEGSSGGTDRGRRERLPVSKEFLVYPEVEDNGSSYDSYKSTELSTTDSLTVYS